MSEEYDEIERILKYWITNEVYRLHSWRSACNDKDSDFYLGIITKELDQYSQLNEYQMKILMHSNAEMKNDLPMG